MLPMPGDCTICTATYGNGARTGTMGIPTIVGHAATLPAQVAAFPGRAAALVRALGNQIAAEVQKKKEAELKRQITQMLEQVATLEAKLDEVEALTAKTIEQERRAVRKESERRLLEAQLRHAQRLEAMGALAGGIEAADRVDLVTGHPIYLWTITEEIKRRQK